MLRISHSIDPNNSSFGQNGENIVDDSLVTFSGHSIEFPRGAVTGPNFASF